MATTYKAFTNNDITNSRTLLHESIPITGSIVSGTYYQGGTETNIKSYSHGMFQSVYDYPHLSSSANHLFDLTMGYSNQSRFSSSANTQNSKKINVYNQMAQVLMGFEATGSTSSGVVNRVRLFDQDGDLTGGQKLTECVFMNFSRLLTKDEIQKGSFSLELGVTRDFRGNTFRKRVKVLDTGAKNSFHVNGAGGEYGILIATSSGPHGTLLVNDTGTLGGGQKVGLLFYQAGVAVITSSLFLDFDNDQGLLSDGGATNTNSLSMSYGTGTSVNALFTGSTIEATCDSFRNRIYNVQFNNTTELNSTIYFCRAHHNDFNYSTNPTYLSGSKIIVKDTSTDKPISYMTTVGLYSPDNELLAVAKLSEPLKKDPTTELTLRVRLDY